MSRKFMGRLSFRIINRIVWIATFSSVLLLASCQNDKEEKSGLSITPDAGSLYNSGTKVHVQVTNSKTLKLDSIVYSIDSLVRFARKDTAAVEILTDSLPLGPRIIAARIFFGGSHKDVSTNIILLASKAPEELSYRVEKVFPHDTSAYTEGLEYHDGYLYESTGEPDHSYIKKIDLSSGKVLQSVKLEKQYFGEGITLVGNKIIQLTYREHTGFIYDKNTFKRIGTFPYNWGPEGWALCFNGQQILNNDSSNKIWFLNKDSLRPEHFIEVYDDKGPIDSLNEMQFISGKIYSNVFTHDTIVVINPHTGTVLQRIDMANLYPVKDRPNGFNYGQNVLNGIAWDEKGKRIFVTGKKWPYLYQVRFVKK